jgi:hypothetical protein
MLPMVPLTTAFPQHILPPQSTRKRGESCLRRASENRQPGGESVDTPDEHKPLGCKPHAIPVDRMPHGSSRTGHTLAIYRQTTRMAALALALAPLACGPTAGEGSKMERREDPIVRSWAPRIRDAGAPGGYAPSRRLDQELSKFELEWRRAVQREASASRSEATSPADEAYSRALRRIDVEVLRPIRHHAKMRTGPQGPIFARLVELFAVSRSREIPTPFGTILVHDVRLVTAYEDGRLRGYPAWTPVDGNEVFLFKELLARRATTTYDHLANSVPVPPPGREASESQRIVYLADFFYRRAYSTPNAAQECIDTEVAYNVSHEAEHVRRRLMRGFRPGESLDADLEEEIAELQSMVEADPFVVLPGLCEMAGAGRLFARSALRRLTASPPSTAWQVVLSRLDGMKDLPQREWKDAAQKAYEDADDAWARTYGRRPQRSRGG